ncbi:MAG: WD40/YVTN/BNR-like repeat-containing protein [Gammaproteobacteria bacterium]
MNRIRTHAWAIALAAFGMAPLAFAMPPRLFQGLSWRFLGPNRGGRVLAVAGIPHEPNTYYMGSVDGGVFKTTDGGVVWQPLFQHEPVSSIGALAIAPSNPKIIYVGTGEADMRSDLSTGGGMFRSDNGGASWQAIGLTQSRQISSLWIDPRNPNIVLAAAMGHAFGPNHTRGVFRTTDGGHHWTRVLYRNDRTGAIQLIANPRHAHELYAVLWNAIRPPWSQYPPNQGPGSGIWRSTDSGRHWAPLHETGLPKHPGRIGLAIASNGHLFYAVVSAKNGGIFRSTDGGHHWTRINHDHRLFGRGWYFGGIYVDPHNSQAVYVLNTAMYRSLDGGHHFTCIKGSPSGDDFHTLWIDPVNPERMIIGVDQGTSITVDGGRTWTPWLNQPTAQIYRLTTDNRFRYHIYASQQDSGSLNIVSRSRRGIVMNSAWSATAGGEAGYVIPDPQDPHIVYGTDIGGSVTRYDSLTGDAQNISPWPFNTFGTPLPQAHYRYPWVVPLALSPQNPNTLYVGSQVLWQSDNRGGSWRIISPDLTGASVDHLTPATGEPTLADAAQKGYGTIYSLSPSPLRAGEIWVGTTDGLVWLTRDDGTHWHNVTPPSIKPWSRINRIQASPFSAGAAYLAVNRQRVNDLRPYIYRTNDFGRHWTRITRGIPSDDYVHVVRIDPKRRGLLFAGTEFGLYVSFDHGAHWQRFNLNLPTTAIHDIAIHNNDLIVGTHGRGIWVLDDITSLIQDRPGLAKRTAFLFRPATAYRIRRTLFRAEPFPPEVPHGMNPPAGAIIDYYLKSGTKTPLTLAIEDRHGQILREFASTTRKRPQPLAKNNFPAFWKAPINRLPDHAGLNRFVWHLRTRRPLALHYAFGGPGLLHNTPVSPQGPYVPPGIYRLILTVDGHHYTEPLTVRLDPNDHLDARGACIQYRWAARATNGVSTITYEDRSLIDLQAEVRSRLTQVPHRIQNGFHGILRAIRDWHSTNHPARLEGHLETLAGFVDGPTTLPTETLQTALRRSFAELITLEAGFRDIQVHLHGINHELRQRGIPEIPNPVPKPRLLPLRPPVD